MKEIAVSQVRDTVKELFLKANYVIGEDMYSAISDLENQESSPVGKFVLRQIRNNYDICREERLAICQDTGMALVYLDVGMDVHLTGGDLEEAINQGIREAYRDGYLRKSVVRDPLFDRTNTGDNTPGMIRYRIIPGDELKITVCAKGFGSENMSRAKMLIPADGVDGFRDFVMEVLRYAGPNTCPPTVVGIGVGGTLDVAADLAKRATMREVGAHSENPKYAKLEEELLEEINCIGTGPAGLGGNVTAIAVNIEYAPTHIASIPVVVNLCCHACRHAEAVL